MSINTFLEFGGGAGDLTNGTIAIFAKTLAAANLDPSFTLKTDSLGVIQTSLLAISDTTGLQTILDSKIGSPLAANLDVNKKILQNIGTSEFCETGAGTDVISMSAPASITGGHDFILPPDVGSGNDVLTSNGAGATSWEAAGAGDVESASDFTVDNRIVITDTVSGVKNVQQSVALLSDTGDLSGLIGLDVSGGNNILLQSSLLSPTAILIQGTGIATGVKIESFGSPLILLASGSTAGITLDSSGNAGIVLTHAGALGSGVRLDSGGRVDLVGGVDILMTAPEVKIDHTSTEDDENAVRISCNAAGFADAKAVHSVFTTGALAAGDQQAAILTTINENAAAGGRIFGLAVNSTETGSATVHALGVSSEINPILQNSGTFGDADTLLNIAVDVTVALSGGGAGNITIFVADNNDFTVGDAAQYSEIEFIVDTGASGGGVAPTFEFSTGVGTWAFFSPQDGTSGFRNTGIVSWNLSDVSTWAVGTGSEFLIRITRTRNTLATLPILDLVQISSTTEYSWDSSGDLIVNNITANTVSYSPGFIEGLQVSDASVSTKTIAIGSCRDDTNIFNIVSSGTLTPSIAASGANGLDTGSEASDTWYSIWVIAGGGNPVASLLSVSSSSPTLPGTYTVKRRVGWVRNDGSSNFYDDFTQSNGRDRLILWRESEVTLEVLTNGGATTYADVDLSEFVPPTCQIAYLNMNHDSDFFTDSVNVRPNGSSLTETAYKIYGGDTTGNGLFFMETDSAQIIEYENSSAGEETDIWVVGYVDAI